jgi:hypothetical protein
MSVLSLVGGCLVRELDPLNATVDGFGECPHGPGIQGRERLALDGSELESLVAELGENPSWVFEEAAAKSRIGCQPSDEGLDIAVRHAERYCGSRSGVSG